MEVFGHFMSLPSKYTIELLSLSFGEHQICKPQHFQFDLRLRHKQLTLTETVGPPMTPLKTCFKDLKIKSIKRTIIHSTLGQWNKKLHHSGKAVGRTRDTSSQAHRRNAERSTHAKRSTLNRILVLILILKNVVRKSR